MGNRKYSKVMKVMKGGHSAFLRNLQHLLIKELKKLGPVHCSLNQKILCLKMVSSHNKSVL